MNVLRIPDPYFRKLRKEELLEGCGGMLAAEQVCLHIAALTIREAKNPATSWWISVFSGVCGADRDLVA